MYSENPHISLIVKSIREFREGKLDLIGLQQNLSAVTSALEGDVPNAVSNAIRKSEAWVDSIRFTISRTEQKVEVEKVLQELELILNQYKY